MERAFNHTPEDSFQLLGFPGLQLYKILFFFVFFLIYLMTLSGNIMIICVTQINTQLHKPMYYFLTNLSFLEVSYTSVVIPKMLENFLVSYQRISTLGCFIQMYLFCAFGATESLLLAIMAYDRYLAICQPLQYPRLLHHSSCQQLVFSCWLSGCFASLIPTISISTLPFCSARIIDHFFCDLLPVLKLSCSNTQLIELSIFILTFIMSFGTFSWTLISYVFIISAILHIRSAESRERAFSTCASHLIVVSMYYGTVISMYMGPKGSQYLNKILSILYTVITPLFNPFIYSLRNREVKAAIQVICGFKIVNTKNANILDPASKDFAVRNSQDARVVGG